MIKIYRLKFIEDGRSKPSFAWVMKMKVSANLLIYRTLKADGDRQNHYLILHPTDILSEKEARMNGKYERLEIVK